MILALPLLGAIGSSLASAATGEAGKMQRATARANLAAADASAPADFSATLLAVAGSSTPPAARSETPSAPHVRIATPF